jgi:hypothetical protein
VEGRVERLCPPSLLTICVRGQPPVLLLLVSCTKRADAAAASGRDSGTCGAFLDDLLASSLHSHRGAEEEMSGGERQGGGVPREWADVCRMCDGEVLDLHGVVGVGPAHAGHVACDEELLGGLEVGLLRPRLTRLPLPRATRVDQLVAAQRELVRCQHTGGGELGRLQHGGQVVRHVLEQRQTHGTGKGDRGDGRPRRTYETRRRVAVEDGSEGGQG